MLNPAQAEALPHVFARDENLLVVAPTGAGKTVIGMAAALRTVVQQGRKSAWLVPQRSLTDELDRELAGWRDHGLRVERLSGEHTVDIDRIHRADLWVATTEKFEAICRASAFREALADVGHAHPAWPRGGRAARPGRRCARSRDIHLARRLPRYRLAGRILPDTGLI